MAPHCLCIEHFLLWALPAFCALLSQVTPPLQPTVGGPALIKRRALPAMYPVPGDFVCSTLPACSVFHFLYPWTHGTGSFVLLQGRVPAFELAPS